jgi:single-strand DNA-binding protein
MADNNVTLVGNVTRDPELRFTNSGIANVRFGIAVNHRRRNSQTNEWDEQTSFFNVTCWREMAENVSESLTKGTRVVVTGRFEQQSWDDKTTGEKRTSFELIADEVAPSLRWASAQVKRNERRSDGGGGFSGGGSSTPPPFEPPMDEEPF